jgi:hypothetical protein
METIPIGNVCPACGSGEFRKVRARRWIAFTDDRICKECGERYAPPTPKWAGVVFMLFGVIMFAAGAGLLIAGIFGLLRGRPDVLGIVFAACLLILGPLAVIHGIRAMISAGSV